MTEWNAILERIAPSVVALEVQGSGGALPGVTMPGGYVAGWAGLVAQASTPTDLFDLTIRQGERSWRAQIDGYRHDWALCGVAISGPPPWPPIDVRASVSLAEDEEVAFVGVANGHPTLITTAPLLEQHFSSSAERPYERACRWLAIVDTPLHGSGALVIDAQGRIAGLAEADPGIPLLAFVLPTEYMTRLGASVLVSLLGQGGRHAQAVSVFRESEARLIDDAWALCAAGQAFEALGDIASALRVWRCAAHLDPDNPWPGQQLLRLGDDQEVV